MLLFLVLRTGAAQPLRSMRKTVRLRNSHNAGHSRYFTFARTFRKPGQYACLYAGFRPQTRPVDGYKNKMKTLSRQSKRWSKSAPSCNAHCVVDERELHSRQKGFKATGAIVLHKMDFFLLRNPWAVIDNLVSLFKSKNQTVFLLSS